MIRAQTRIRGLCLVICATALPATMIAAPGRPKPPTTGQPEPEAPAPAATAESAAPSAPAAAAAIQAKSAASAPREASRPAADTGQRLTAHSARIFVKVAIPEDTRKAMLDALDKAGGYPLLLTATKMEFKVPPAALEPLLTMIEGLGQVLDKSRERKDHTLDIARLKAQLKGRRALMRKLRSFLEQADAGATANIEAQMLGLLRETEAIAGSLRQQQDHVRFARVTVDLQWQSSVPMQYVRPPFAWLETVGVDAVLSDFGSDN